MFFDMSAEEHIKEAGDFTAVRADTFLFLVNVLNRYSASETHAILCGEIRGVIDSEASHCSVGPPTDPEHTYVLGEGGKKVDVGVNRELFVGGSLLARRGDCQCIQAGSV